MARFHLEYTVEDSGALEEMFVEAPDEFDAEHQLISKLDTVEFDLVSISVVE
jgi:hypothetical protein